jgi:hypothetical protein
MKVDAEKLIKQIDAMPLSVRIKLKKAIRRNTEQAANMARRLVPAKSGELKGWIHTKYNADGLTASVEAAPPTKYGQVKANSVEFGRENGNRGKTSAQPYIRVAQRLQKAKFAASVKAAVKSGLKAVSNVG